MERAEPPPASKVQYLRGEGKSYPAIAKMYGLSLDEARALGTPQDQPLGPTVQRRRSQGWSYREIADDFGISVEEAYRLGHSNEVIDLRAAEERVLVE